MREKILVFLLLFTVIIGSAESIPSTPIKESIKVPGFKPDTDIIEPDKNDQFRRLEKTFTVMLENKINVFVPLEIITDIDIEATVIEKQHIKVPFDIELNRKPEKAGHYIAKFSEKEIDIDDDGKLDTYIVTPEFLEERINQGNYVEIFGENISEEGTYNKKLYITIDVKS